MKCSESAIRIRLRKCTGWLQYKVYSVMQSYQQEGRPMRIQGLIADLRSTQLKEQSKENRKPKMRREQKQATHIPVC